jgi:2-(3-amino-3-carboxypropyl)histidine synthase
MMEESNKLETPDIFSDFSFNIQELISWIDMNDIKTLAIQLPEGLKLQSLELINYLENQLEINIILLADPCFGACDYPSDRLTQLAIDGIAHFGHTEIPNCPQGQVPIKYIELNAKTNPVILLRQEKNLETIGTEFKPPNTIGLLANMQFIKYLNEIKIVLENADIQVELGSGDERVKYDGQVLGCNFSAARGISSRVNGFLFVGDGIFHPLGVSFATNKTVLAFDPFADEFQNINPLKEKILRQRNGAIARAKECRNFGILLSNKPGQNRTSLASRVKEKIKGRGYQSTIICLDNIKPELIDYLPFQAYINTACPRLTIDDYLLYKKAMISPIELEIVLGERDWEKYQFDEIM